MARNVAVLVGSLRKESFSRKVANAIAATAGDKLNFDFIEIADLPFYSEDVEAAGAPAPWTRFREQILKAAAILIATPEYNRSMSAVLKNAIDVGSRPLGKSVWTDKPGAIVSSSPSPIGGFNANQHARQSLGVLNVHLMAHPEMYLGQIHTWFDDAGKLKDESAQKLLNRFLEAYVKWIERFAK